MARIELCDDLPANIVELDVADSGRLQDCYERGFLIVLRGLRLQADFGFLSAIRDPAPNNNRRKYLLTHPDHAHRDCVRPEAWGHFREKVFAGDEGAFARFECEVRNVNQQLLEIADGAFPSYRYRSCPVAWKFQDLSQGENLHIDNLDQCETHARMRVFANLADTPRRWAVGAHLRHYASECFESAGLQQHLMSPFHFNRALTVAAFGDNRYRVGEDVPRHRVEFEPGEVWLLNSAMTAHQVLYGKLLVLTTFAFPYRNYRNPGETLPRVISEIGRGKLGTLRYARHVVRHHVGRVLRRGRAA